MGRRSNKLSLNIAKTEFMIVGSRQRINANQDNNMSIGIDDHEINGVHSVKSLGLYIDSHLTWSLHIEKICKKISSAIGAMKRMRSCITTKTAIQVYSALIQPHFDYCCSVCDGLGETLSMKIQKLQNRAGRVITRSSYNTNASDLLNALHLDNLYIRRRKLKAQLKFKILKGNLPSYLLSFTFATLSMVLEIIGSSLIYQYREQII